MALLLTAPQPAALPAVFVVAVKLTEKLDGQAVADLVHVTFVMLLPAGATKQTVRVSSGAPLPQCGA